TIRPRPQFRLYGQFVGVFHPTHSAIHKRLEILHAVKDSLEVHPVLSPLSDIRSHLYPYRVGGQDAPLPVNPLLAELQPIPGYGLPTNFPEEPKSKIYSATSSRIKLRHFAFIPEGRHPPEWAANMPEQRIIFNFSTTPP